MGENCLTEKEIDFCDLYVNGGFGVAGDYIACYKEAFGIEDKRAARRLMARPEVKDKIKENIEDFKNNEENQAIDMKIQITDTLQKAMKETSTDVYATPKGHKLSPAPLRAVAVNSAKALADLHLKKPAQSHDVNLGSSGDSGIIFNVVAPQALSKEENDQTKGN